MSEQDSSSSVSVIPNPVVNPGAPSNPAGAPTGGGSHAEVDLSNDQSVAALVAAMTALHQTIAAQGVTLDVQGRQSALKWRGGGNIVAPLVFSMGDQYGVVVPHYSTTQGQTDLSEVARLSPLVTIMTTLAQTVKDTVLAKESAVWQAVTSIYGSLQSLASHNSELQNQLSVVRSYFATKQTATNADLKKQLNEALSARGLVASGASGAGATGTGSASSTTAKTEVGPRLVERRQHHEVRHVGERRAS